MALLTARNATGSFRTPPPAYQISTPPPLKISGLGLGLPGMTVLLTSANQNVEADWKTDIRLKRWRLQQIGELIFMLPLSARKMTFCTTTQSFHVMSNQAFDPQSSFRFNWRFYATTCTSPIRAWYNHTSGTKLPHQSCFESSKRLDGRTRQGMDR